MVLLRSALVMDGSADPPGDRIDVTVFFQTDEQAATVRVRPYLVSGEHNQHAARVKAARSERNRDKAGYCEVATRVVRPANATEADARIIVAYADLDLPAGTHQIAYEVALLSDGQVVASRPTPLSRVTVSGQVRGELQPQVAATAERQLPATVNRTAQAVIVQPGASSQTPAVVTKPVQIVSTAPAAPSTPPPAVSIPGGFARTPGAAATVAPASPATASKDLAPLTTQPWAPASDLLTAEQRTVYFATNRAYLQAPGLPSKPTPATAAVSGSPLTSGPAPAKGDGSDPPPATSPPAANPASPFGNDAVKQLTYGSCIVNFPVLHHTKGNLETPDWWQQRDPSLYFLLQNTTAVAADAFQKSMTGPNDVLVFVHGFDNTFDDAVLRVAQLQYDIQFPGRAIAFSWPSQGSESVDAYKADADQAEASAAALADLLRTLLAATSAAGSPKPPQIHIIAHSMGNRILLNAMYNLAASGAFKDRAKPFGQIILAAPDVGAAMFNNLISSTTQHAQQVTYYFSNTDMALALSQQINLYEPAGMDPLFAYHVDTIDADSVDTSFIGHSYFAASPLVLLDMQLMVTKGLDPDHRMPPLMSKSTVYGHTLWSFTAQKATEAVAQK